MNTLTLTERRLARHHAGAGKATPVVLISSGPLPVSPPRLTGESYHYTTRGGTWVRHPSAYRRRGWSNLVYVPSTRRVEVTRAWLLAAQLAEALEQPR